MKKEVLKKIAKDHKINLDHFDSVISHVNRKHTKIYVTFALSENVGGERYYYQNTTISLSVMAIIRRCENIDDYTTDGWTYIWEIK